MFRLDKYFDTTKIKYIFANHLMDENGVTDKTVFLKNFGICYDTFRVEKSRERVRNDSVDRILDFYKISSLKLAKKSEYEYIINKLYYSIYFKEIECIKTLLETINKYINENNILKPIFVLFKIFAYMNIGENFSEIKELTYKDYDYVKSFKKGYFIGEFEIIFEAIRHGLENKDNLVKLNILADAFPNLKWLYLTSIGSIYYLNRQDEKALNIYMELVEEFKELKNLERLMITYSNMCFIYNKLKRYTKSIEISNQSLEYVYSQNNSIWIKYMIMHYFFANFMLEKYNVIVDFVSNDMFDKNLLNWVSASICLLAAAFIKEDDKVQTIKENFSGNENIKLILTYLKTKDTKVLHLLRHTPYIKEIILKLGHK